MEKRYQQSFKRKIKKKVLSELKSKLICAVPGLTVILVGEDSPSKIYVRNKEKSAIEVGINSEIIKYPNDVDEKGSFRIKLKNLTKMIKCVRHISSTTTA